MDKFEKVERLRERANVTYEEAKAALEQANDDLLDAILILEKQGKVRGPKANAYSTTYEEQKQYLSLQEKVLEQSKPITFLGLLKKVLLLARDFVLRTSFRITREEKTLFVMPTLALVLILVLTFEVSVPVLLIAMLFKVRYHFEGEQHTEKANTILNKAGDIAGGLESEIYKRAGSYSEPGNNNGNYNGSYNGTGNPGGSYSGAGNYNGSYNGAGNPDGSYSGAGNNTGNYNGSYNGSYNGAGNPDGSYSEAVNNNGNYNSSYNGTGNPDGSFNESGNNTGNSSESGNPDVNNNESGNHIDLKF